MQIFMSFMKGIKATNMLQRYTSNFNLFRMVVKYLEYQFFPILIIQMPFSQTDFRTVGKSLVIFITIMGEQWLSGRVLDWRLKDYGFEPHRRHCVVSLSKTY